MNINIITKYKNMQEKNHTSKEWYKMIDDLRCTVVEVPEWVYFHFLESVPPIYPENKIGFFNSEPLTFNKEGQPTYYYFFTYKTKHYGTVCTEKTQDFLLKELIIPTLIKEVK